MTQNTTYTIPQTLKELGALIKNLVPQLNVLEAEEAKKQFGVNAELVVSFRATWACKKSGNEMIIKGKYSDDVNFVAKSCFGPVDIVTNKHSHIGFVLPAEGEMSIEEKAGAFAVFATDLISLMQRTGVEITKDEVDAIKNRLREYLKVSEAAIYAAEQPGTEVRNPSAEHVQDKVVGAAKQ